MQTVDLKSSQFREEREASWIELESLIRRVEQLGARRLTAEELHRLPTLYRGAVSSLSVARAISLDRNVLDYLENLVGRAYIAVYGTKRPAFAAVRDFVLRGFPSTVRRYWPALLASTTILLLGILTGYLLTSTDVDRFYDLVPEAVSQGRNPAASTEDLREVLYHHPEEGTLGATLNIFATFLFTNNAKVGILSFALGFAAGAPVVLLLFYNGLLLGAMAALYDARGMGGEFWAWVLPHGVTELGAVCLCGMAGLILGASVVFPGERGRLENLAARGPDVAMVVIGAVLLFFVAALIEGFFRQLVHDEAIRWSVAAATAVAWTLYFALCGRDDVGRADR